MANEVGTLMSRHTAMAIVAVAGAILLLVVARASAVVSFPLTVALASGWCAWLEKHPEDAVKE